MCRKAGEDLSLLFRYVYRQNLENKWNREEAHFTTHSEEKELYLHTNISNEKRDRYIRKDDY